MDGVLNKTPAGALSWWRQQRKEEVMMPKPRAASRAGKAHRRSFLGGRRAGHVNQAGEDEWDWL